MFREMGLSAPSRLCSVMLTIGADGPCSAAHVARKLDISHQLVTQRINSLAKMNWVRQTPDPEDGRASNWALTREGRRNLPRIEEAVRRAERAFSDLYAETGIDLAAAITQIQKALVARPIASRAQDADARQARRAASR